MCSCGCSIVRKSIRLGLDIFRRRSIGIRPAGNARIVRRTESSRDATETGSGDPAGLAEVGKGSRGRARFRCGGGPRISAAVAARPARCVDGRARDRLRRSALAAGAHGEVRRFTSAPSAGCRRRSHRRCDSGTCPCGERRPNHRDRRGTRDDRRGPLGASHQKSKRACFGISRGFGGRRKIIWRNYSRRLDRRDLFTARSGRCGSRRRRAPTSISAALTRFSRMYR